MALLGNIFNGPHSACSRTSFLNTISVSVYDSTLVPGSKLALDFETVHIIQPVCLTALMFFLYYLLRSLSSLQVLREYDQSYVKQAAASAGNVSG